MDFKKLILGGITGGVLFFLLGWLIYGILLMDFMNNNPGTAGVIGKPEPDYLYLIIGNMSMGFMMAYIFIRSNVNTLAAGLVMGGIVGLLLSVGFDCVMYATTTMMSKKAMAADVAGSTIMSAIVGAVVGMILGMGKKTA